MQNKNWEDLLLEAMTIETEESYLEAYKAVVDIDNTSLKDLLWNFSKYVQDIEMFEQLEALADSIAEEFSQKNEPKKALIVKVFGYFTYYLNADNINLYPAIVDKLKTAIYILDILKEKKLQASFINNLAVIYFQRKKYTKAESLYNNNIEIYQNLIKKYPNRFENDLAMSFQNLASLFFERKKYLESEKLYREAIEIYEKSLNLRSRDKDRFATSLYNLAGILFTTHQYNEVETLYQRAIDIYHKLNLEVYENNLLTCLQNFANYYVHLGQYDKAQNINTEITEIRAKESSNISDEDLAMQLQSSALVSFQHKKYDEAESMFREAIKIYKKLIKKHPNMFKNYLATTLNNLVLLLTATKRYDEAEREALKLVEVYKELSQIDKSFEFEVARSLQNFANIFSKAKRDKESESFYKEAISIYEKSPLDAFQEPLAVCFQNLATLIHKSKRYEEAKILFSKAIQIYEYLNQKHSKKFASNLAMLLQNLALLLIDTKEYEESKIKHKQAIAIYEQLMITDSRVYKDSFAMTLQNLAMLLYRTKDYDEAETTFNRAIKIYQELRESNPNIFENDLALILQNLAYLYYDTKELNRAKKLFYEAIELLEDSREALSSFREKINFSKENNKTYEGLIKTLILIKEYNSAVTIIEKNKARAIGDIISNDSFSSKVSQTLIDDYKRLENERYYLLEELNQDEINNSDDMKRKYYQNQSELFNLKKRIIEIDPTFLPYTKPLEFNQIVEVAKESKKCFVSFYITQDSSFISIFYPNGEVEYITLLDFSIFYFHSKIVQKWLMSYYENSDDFKQVSNTILVELYHSLLKELVEKLKAKNIKDIVFVPNKSLSLLPLHACWYKQEGKKRYLIDDFIISYVPSISIYNTLQKKKLYDDFSSFNIINPKGDLMFSALEGFQIESLTQKTDSFWHNKAKGDRLIESSSNIIHLSCHGSYNIDKPLDSAFAFSDKNLKLKEIINSINLTDNYLTVLSACETGMINYKEVSDEYLGFSIGFLMAKSPTIWSTLWSVDDFSTALILLKAYEELIVNKESKANALRKAQIWIKDLTAEEIIAILERNIEKIEEKKENPIIGNIGLRKNDLNHYIRFYKKRLDRLKTFDAKSKIFKHPFYWASFTCIGVS